MKRIAIVYRNLAGLSGVPNVVFSQAAALVAMGYRVDLIGQKFDRKRVDAAGVRSRKIRRIREFKRWNLRWFAARADRIGRHYDFVVGHGHHRQQNVLMLHNCIRRAYECTAGRRAGADNGADASLQDDILRSGRFGLCIANSGLMRDDLVHRYGIAAESVQVVYPGYDTNRFNLQCRDRFRSRMRQSLGLAERQLLIGLITSGAFDKRGVDIFLQAYARTSARTRQASRLLIVGRPSPEKYIKLAASLGIAGNLTFKPASADVESYYAALDIGVHPARFEEFGLTVQEMMACGVPVITNRQVGAAELLPPEAYQCLPRHSDPDNLSAQLERFVQDVAWRRWWAENAAAAAGANSLEINLEKTLTIFRRAGL